MSAINEGTLQQRNVKFDSAPRRAQADLPPPVRAGTGFLATALIEEDAQSRGARAARTGLALCVQAAIVVTLLVAPLFVTEAIDLHQFEKTMLIAPPPSAAPPVIHAQAVPPRQFLAHPALLTAPTVIPKKVDTSADLASSAPSISDAGGVVGGTGDVLGAALSAPPPPPVAASRPKGPIRISSGMKEPRCISAPAVVYSPIARTAHIQGTVVVEAIIDEQGNVTQVRAISGPALLIASAVKAVSERKYEPTILDGQPVSIRLNVTVDFHLS